MTALQKVKAYVLTHRRELAFPLLFWLIAVGWVLYNGSFLFEYAFINRYGDQHHYYALAYNLANGDFPKSPYTLGYPLFYLPWVLLTGTQTAWQSIMNCIIPLQAFVLMPAVAYLIFKNKTKRWSLITLACMVLYYVAVQLRSDDILIKYNFFGLVPLSEPLAIFCLIAAYYVYLRYLKTVKSNLRWLILFAILFAGALLTRNTIVILFGPIFVDMIWDKKYRQLVYIAGLSFVFYFPQLLYNYLCSKDWLFNGYVWWAENRVEKNTRSIQALYGIASSKMFSFHYLLANFSKLFLQYAPFVALGVLIKRMSSTRFTNLVLIFSVLNILFYLAYWWSAAGGLLDRFLLPNFYLLMFILSNNLLTQKGRHENKRHS